MKTLSLLLPLAGLLAAPALAQCTTSWTDPAGGDWSDPANWSAGVPDANDTACIIRAGTYTVTLDADAILHALRLGGSSGEQTLAVGPGRTFAVNAPSNIVARGVLDWTGGTILTGAGSLLNAGGVIRLTGNADKHLGVGGAATLVNVGTVAWSAGALRFGGDTVVENHGLLDVQGDLFLNPPLAPDGVIRNRSTGVLRKSAGPTFSTLFVYVENEGVVESLSGLLQLGHGSLHTDARLEAAAGAEVQLYVGTHAVAGTLSGSPTGTVSFLQSQLVAAPGGATLDFAGTGFEWAGGRIQGGHPLTNVGHLRFTGGQKQLRDGTTLTNAGTVAWASGSFLIATGASFVNEGVVEVQHDDTLPSLLGAGFVNAAGGVYRKTAGAGNHLVDLAFQNAGTLESLSGAIYLRGGSTQTDATVEAGAGASVVFGGGTHTVAGTLAGGPAGRVALGAAGALAAGPGGGTLALGGTGFQWEGGALGGGVALTNAGLLRITTPFSSKTLADGAVLDNTGTVAWEGGVLTLGGGVTIENAGLFDLRGDFALFTDAAEGLFVNADGGLFRKSAGTSAGWVGASVHFANEAGATISAESGMLAFFDLDHQPGALVQGTASFSGLGSPHGGDAAPGPGLGTLNWASGFEPSAASTLFVELGPLDHDRLETGVSATLAGALHLDFPGLYAPRLGDAFEVVSTFAVGGAIAGTFAAVEAPVGFVFDVVYAPTNVTVTVADEPAVIVSAAPEHTPFVIPADGGDLRFAVRLANTTLQAQAVDVWAETVLPNGAVVPVRQRALTLPPSATVTRYFRLHVPGRAPAGTYTMRLLAGTYPAAARSADDFTFEKAPPVGASPAAEAPLAWRVVETEADAYVLAAADAWPEAEEAPPKVFALHAASPNPSAGRATLRYDLPEASAVRVAVYDLLGREVAVLVDGEAEAGRHAAVLDGHALASGIYVVRMTAGAASITQRVTVVR